MSPIRAGRAEFGTRPGAPSRMQDHLSSWEEPGVLHVAGVVDVTTRQLFTRALAECETNPCMHALDLSSVEFFSSAGAGCFVERGWTDRPHVPIIASRIVRRVLVICDMVYLLDQHGWRHA